MTFGPVGIFWDYENCSPQHGAGFSVVDNIRQIALQYGSVKVFKAYLELSEQNSSKSPSLRSELQSCGVSLTDCPHNGRKDVADKMMIVDMLTFAIDTPAPATIIVISGDRDFVYAVSVLRLRQYHVVVVAPGSAHSSLRSQASKVHDWDTAIVNKSAPPPTSRIQSANVDGPGGPDVEHDARHSGHNPTQSSGNIRAPRPQRHSYFQESGLYSPASASLTPSPVKARQDESLPPDPERRPAFVFPKGPATDTQTVTTEPPRGAAFDSRAGHATHSRSISMPPKGLSSAPVDSTPVSPMNHAPSTNPSGLAPPELAASRKVTEDSEQTEAGTRDASMENDSIPIADVIGEATRSISAQRKKAENGAFLPTSRPAHTRQSEPKEVHVTLPAVLKPANTTPSLHIATGDQSTTLPTAADRQGGASMFEFGSLSSLNIETRTDLPTSSFAAQVPPYFVHMVDILEAAHREGRPRLLRSHVAVQLVQRTPTIYQQAGVDKFKDYAAFAERLGLVELGGIQGTAWIALGPSYLGA